MKKYLFAFIFICFFNPVLSQSWIGTGNFNFAIQTVYFDDSTNTLYVGGGFTTFNGNQMSYILKKDSSGWTSMGTGMNYGVGAITKYNGEIYAGGAFTMADGNVVSKIAKWNGSTWSAVGSGFIPGPAGGCYALQVFNGELYVAGNFHTGAGSNFDQIARWNGTVWNSVGTGLTGPNIGAMTMTVFQGALHVGGNFSSAGGVYANKIARWDGSSWSNVGNGTSGTIISLVVFDNELFVGGTFFTGCGIGCASNSVCRWNGTSWLDAGYGMTTASGVFSLGVYNGHVIAGGYFTAADGHTVENLAIWNGSSWAAFPAGGVNGPIYSFANTNEGFYAGGNFTLAGGNSVSHLALIAMPLNTPGVFENNKAVVYPNPFTENINIECAFVNGTYELRDISGRLLERNIISNDPFQLSLIEYESGIFFLSVLNGEAKTIIKLVKN